MNNIDNLQDLELDIADAVEVDQPRIELSSFIDGLKEVGSQDVSPFLVEHGIQPHGLLMGSNEELYVPIKGEDGELVAAQKIMPNGETQMWEELSASGGCYEFSGNDSIVLFAEQFHTAATLFEATGYTTIMYVESDNLSSLLPSVRENYPNTVMMLCSENGMGNRGLAIDNGLTLVELSNSMSPTFKLFRENEGSGGVKAFIDSFIDQANLRLPQGFDLTPSGLYYREEGKDATKKRARICDYLKVSALFRSGDQLNWGLLIELIDKDMHTHQLAMPSHKLNGSGTKAFMDMLTKHGFGYTPKYAAYIKQYLLNANPISRAMSVNKPGWYDNQYVIPNMVLGEVIGEGKDKIIYQSDEEPLCDVSVKGSLNGWKKNVSSLCIGNSRLTFGVSTAFATILMNFVNSDSVGFHFRGPSSRGKTTILQIAKSVWGSSKNLPRWRATVNGLEALATHHNHSLLCIDELSQVNDRDVGHAVYTLGNSEGKQRMGSQHLTKKRASWQMMYLSAGEESLRAIVERSGSRVKAGQEVRFVDIPANVNDENGAFNTIHDAEDGSEFANKIKRNVSLYHGSAARTFIKLVSKNSMKMRGAINHYRERFLELLQLDDADGQVIRVANQFALVAASGEIATKLDITGWESGSAFRAAKECFEAWVEERGGMGAQEDKEIIKAIRGKLLARGNMWCHTKDKEAARNGKAWGLRDENTYYIYLEVFEDILCEGFDAKYAASVLRKKGYLNIGNDGRDTKNKNVKGKSTRMYHINTKILSDEE
ncbi:DUF927 domain-containing protein [Vibrio fluvialis]|nr:DUF927 domain-containing protein [Vibrio fluvialis]